LWVFGGSSAIPVATGSHALSIGDDAVGKPGGERPRAFEILGLEVGDRDLYAEITLPVLALASWTSLLAFDQALVVMNGVSRTLRKPRHRFIIPMG
jgi:hypothetical protein